MSDQLLALDVYLSVGGIFMILAAGICENGFYLFWGLGLLALAAILF